MNSNEEELLKSHSSTNAIRVGYNNDHDGDSDKD